MESVIRVRNQEHLVSWSTGLRLGIALAMVIFVSPTSGSTGEQIDTALRAYAEAICLGHALAAGGESYELAGQAIVKGAWWYVEATDYSPAVYDAVFGASKEAGGLTTPSGAVAHCARFAKSGLLGDVILGALKGDN